MRHASGSPEFHGALADVYQAVKALQHLMSQLISLAKAERPVDENDEVGSFDLVECTAATARSYAARALDHDITISFEANTEHLMVMGHHIFAGEMIANLLDNAIRYGNRGGHITIRVLEDSSIVEVEDDGPGVSVEDRERVFERFYRLPHSADREGSGLGLSIVQALGWRLGAAVSLETPKTGKGVKAVVRFRSRPPVAKANASAA
jgi:two-component system sensor histidine kinase TctE